MYIVHSHCIQYTQQPVQVSSSLSSIYTWVRPSRCIHVRWAIEEKSSSAQPTSSPPLASSPHYIWRAGGVGRGEGGHKA